MLHEDIQGKIRREIDAELGRDQLPSGNDRVHLPYTDAFLMEVQRFGSILPNGIAHCNIEDIDIGGMLFLLYLYCLYSTSYLLEKPVVLHEALDILL